MPKKQRNRPSDDQPPDKKAPPRLRPATQPTERPMPTRPVYARVGMRVVVNGKSGVIVGGDRQFCIAQCGLRRETIYGPYRVIEPMLEVGAWDATALEDVRPHSSIIKGSLDPHHQA